MDWEYDVGPILDRRNVCWQVSKIRDYEDLKEDHWRAHRELGVLIRNLDDLVQKMYVESVTCRRKKARTTRYKHLIRQIEQSIDEIEQHTTMYGLEFFK